MEVVDDDYPIWLTTGRVVFHYLSGTQTRRIGFLVEQCPHPYLEIHPRLAERYGHQGRRCRGDDLPARFLVLPAKVVKTIRPDTVFIPYHWPGALSANRLTARHLDPVSKIPEFKISACPAQEDHQGPVLPELAELQRMGFEARSNQTDMPEQVF